MAEPETTPPRKPRRWPWYLLAVLMFITLFVVKVVIPVYRQERAIEKIEAIGMVSIESERSGPEWIWRDVDPEKWRGFDRVLRVEKFNWGFFSFSSRIAEEKIGKRREFNKNLIVEINEPELTAADLQGIASPHLLKLALVRVHILPTSLDLMDRATNLEFLDLAQTNCNDHTLEQVARFRRLKFLYLEKTDITDEGLEQLAELTLLEELALDETNISDAGLKSLAGLKNLRKLWIPRTKVTDEGLAALQGMPQLEIVQLDETAVTDNGLIELKTKHVNGLGNLRRLLLLDTRVTDRSLPHYEDLTNLKYLDLRYADVTHRACRSLQLKIPDCEIQWIPWKVRD